jgi:alkyl hydroperoxide reductase subunit AhpC
MAQLDVMPITPGSFVVDFKGFSPSGQIDMIDYWGASWGMVFAFSEARRGVAATELVELVKLGEELKERNVRVLGVCSDSMDNVIKFTQEIKQTFDGARVAFPIIADVDGEFGTAFGLSAPGAEGLLAEAHHIIVVSPDHRVQLSMSYPRSCGVNFREVLRAIDALRVSFYCSGAMTCANWASGEDCFVPVAMSDADAVATFTKGFKAVVPYLRLTPQPDVHDGESEEEELALLGDGGGGGGRLNTAASSRPATSARPTTGTSAANTK